MIERKGGTTFKGNPLTLIGTELKAGDAAPDVELLTKDLQTRKLSECRGQVCVITSVPSLDTGVCEMMTMRFNEEMSKFGGKACLFTISMDLPFAQGRFCSSHNANNIETLSDHRDAIFGKSYGTLIKELRLLSRAVFVIDAQGKITYVQYVKEMTEHPDYDTALNAVKTLVK